MQSTDFSPKSIDALQGFSSLISPNSKKIIIRKGSKITRKRVKSKKIDMKVETDQILPKKTALTKNLSTKISTIMTSPKNSTSKVQIGLAKSRSGKIISRLFGNTSNRSIKLSASPKSSYLSPEEVEFPIKPTKAISLFKPELRNYEQVLFVYGSS